MKRILFCLPLFFFLSYVNGQEILPPLPGWQGKSEVLMLKNDPLITPFEASDGKKTATLDEMNEWFRKLQKQSKDIQLQSMGTSPEGREMLLVKLSSDDKFKYGIAANSDRPVILIQAGIHSGEIDGKDAGMMLLRDIAVGSKKDLLRLVNILFIPVLNIDGHERHSAFGRINQRGPEITGWRSNALNQNLNRDYTKAETDEIKAVIKLINDYNPDLYIDIHVTDGVDYQYDITYGSADAYSPAISDWFKNFYEPYVNKALSDSGHIPGPLVFSKNGNDMSEGNIAYTFSPRFSHSYCDLRQTPAILLENHSLKPFKQRVLGTYIFLEAAITILAETKNELKQAIETDKNNRNNEIPLTWKFHPQAVDTLSFKGVESRKIKSEITGGEFVEWTGKPQEIKIPLFKNNLPDIIIQRPAFYVVPAARKEIIEKLKLHGIKMSTLTSAETLQVEMYRLKDVQPEGKLTSQGRFRVNALTDTEIHTISFAPGSVKIPTDQNLGKLAVVLLEPSSPDSYFQWGYFSEILERTEYFENYVIEPLALKMMKESDSLRSAFENRKKEDPKFSENQDAQLRWWYEKTDYADKNYLLYPVGRLMN